MKLSQFKFRLPEELIAHARSLACPLDYPGDISDDHVLITVTENSQHGDLRREWIACDLAAGVGEEVYQG